jgi:Family of unknown function (DUF5996)
MSTAGTEARSASSVALDAAFPPLPLADWKATRDTVHMYTQVVGKVKLALLPMEPQWGQVPLYLSARGLTTSPIAYRGRSFSIGFDFVAHELAIQVSDGDTRSFSLGRSVAAFYDETMGALRSLGIEVAYRPWPSEVSDPIPFPEDTVHATYDRVSVNRFFRVLARVDAVLKRDRAEFRGRVSPVAFYWGTFDLAYSRYSGRPADPPAGCDVIYRFAMDAETIELGFWPGDERFPEPAFYSFTYPRPAGFERASVEPRRAIWSDDLGEFLLRYDDVRRAAVPENAILDFLRSTYRAGATLAGWDVGALEGLPRAG